MLYLVSNMFSSSMNVNNENDDSMGLKRVITCNHSFNKCCNCIMCDIDPTRSNL